MNKVEIVGRIVNDVKVLTFNDGKKMARTAIAVNGKKKEETQFFNVVAWEKLAQIMETYCTKGKRIAVCGSLKQNDYTSTKGEKWHAVEIIAQEIEFLDSKEKEADKDLIPVDIKDDDLPF